MKNLKDTDFIRKTLDDHPLDLNQSDFFPLLTAAFYGYTDTVSVLLQRGSDPNYSQKDGITALMVACDQGSKDRVNFSHCKTAEMLLDYGAKIDAYCEEGFNPLLFAAADGSLEIVKLLVERGANPNCVFKNDKAYVSNGRITTHRFANWTPIMFAIHEKHQNVVDYLIGTCKLTADHFHKYVELNNLALVKTCVDANVVSLTQHTLQNYCKNALYYGAIETFKYLLSKNTDLISMTSFLINYAKWQKLPLHMYPILVENNIMTLDEAITINWHYKQILKDECMIRYCISKYFHDDKTEKWPLYSAGDKRNRIPEILPYSMIPDVIFRSQFPKDRTLSDANTNKGIDLKIKDLTVGNIINLITNCKSMICTIFVDDAGASGLGGYYTHIYDFMISTSQIIYAFGYSLDMCYGSTHIMCTPKTIDELLYELEESIQDRDCHWSEKKYNPDMLFYGSIKIWTNETPESIKTFFQPVET